ncbi:endonuclease III [Halorhabdus sp. CBA1104]|uniref:endonuclease III domain-containing protein n=1 Tax=Halorhabdus sp. CBA1104 TaxID=1380432 RepID=UPI0012B19D35|nr:endonuclease III [Halorhabdus sp. CBA1104]QGN07162.1 endonuclease III [Halorhabdus sp. CBA1104]
MSKDPEPDRNISGGAAGGGAEVSCSGERTDTRGAAVVDRLGDRYWEKTYGGRDAFECLVRTILSQNTSDAASQPAHDALLERYGDSEAPRLTEASNAQRSESRDDGTDLVAALADADQASLAETISGAGLHNQKSARIIDIAQRIRSEYGGEAAFDAFLRGEPAESVRETLLDMTGVGPKTADCVLLFAGGRDGVFPVDTHVHRIYRRLGIAPAGADHERVREILERDVPDQHCGFGHTASIQFGREYCSARKPACLDGPEACPLYDLCDRVGVDPAASEVVDPAEANQ